MISPGGTITIAGKKVSRLGLGTMRLTGPGTWGDHADRGAALNVLRQAVNRYGITHIDTADAYGPHTAEHLVRDALHPYPDGVLIATKVGLLRPAPGQWVPLGNPFYLRASIEASLRRHHVDRLELCYLHRIDPQVAFEDQLAVLDAMREEGKVGHIGLSKVTREEILRAGKYLTIAAVQNVLNIDAPFDPAVQTCQDLDIPYVAYRPLDAGRLADANGPATALRWLLNLGRHIAPIPSTSRPSHLAEIAAAADGKAI
ncbi:MULTISPECIES: aldo/keto reductase [unclassified Streptomyces]|uniref:aldo/keto reductase n=1 Tax=unclassified Streptomyces TaxID=2593676 RepID=UPI00371C119B